MALLDESARGAQIGITGTYFLIGALLASGGGMEGAAELAVRRGVVAGRDCGTAPLGLGQPRGRARDAVLAC